MCCVERKTRKCVKIQEKAGFLRKELLPTATAAQRGSGAAVLCTELRNCPAGIGVDKLP